MADQDLSLDDLSKPYFGNPNIQKQGALARANAAQRSADTVADPKTLGAVQAGLAAASGMVNPLIGGAVGIAKSIPEAIRTGQPPAPLASQYAEQYLQEHPGYQPDTEYGQEYLGKLGDYMEAAHLPPVVGDLTFAHNVGEVMSPFKEMPKDYVKANPPSAGLSIKPVDNIESILKPEEKITVKPKAEPEPIDEKPVDLTPRQEQISKMVKDHVNEISPEIDMHESVSSDDKPPVESQKPIPSTVEDASSLDNALKISKSKIWNKGRDLKVAMQDAVKAEAEKHGVDVSTESPQTEEYLTKMAIRDGKAALEQNPNAVGWYDLKTRQALAVMSLIHPEIATDLDARNAFTWAMAVTSNGLKVDKNFELAEKAYQQYKDTGKMPNDIGIGTAGGAINKSLDLYNELKDKWGPENLRKFMNSPFTVGEITAIDKNLKPGGEHADVNVNGSAILGPKIGNGFFSNLNGQFDSLTMDRWLVRTWGRWTGTLLKDMPNQTADARTRLSDNMKNILSNPESRSKLSEAIGKDINENLHPDELAVAVQEASMDPKTREVMNQTPHGEEMRKAGNGLAKYLDGQKEAPSGPTERKFIRRVFGNALEQLRQDPQYKDLTMADLQAVLWYAEKRLYESAKEDLHIDDEVNGYADEDAPDYARAAVNVARAKGISDRKINNTLTKEEQHGRTTNARSQDVQETPSSGPQQTNARGFASNQEKSTFIADQAVKRVRSNLNGPDGPSYSYAPRGDGDSKGARVLKNLGVTYKDEWKLGPKAATVFRANDVPAPSFFELDSTGGPKKGPSNAEVFANKISESKAKGKYGASVYVYTPEEYSKMRLFMTKDGGAGVAVKPDGDIVSVFSDGNGQGHGIMQLATAVGGNKLDAFDTVLPRLYSTHGFRPISRTLWDDQFAPEGWDKSTFSKFKHGEPDVVFMAHDPNYFGQHEPNAGKVMRGNNAYNRAVNARDKHLEAIQQRTDK